MKDTEFECMQHGWRSGHQVCPFCMILVLEADKKKLQAEVSVLKHQKEEAWTTTGLLSERKRNDLLRDENERLTEENQKLKEAYDAQLSINRTLNSSMDSLADHITGKMIDMGTCRARGGFSDPHLKVLLPRDSAFRHEINYRVYVVRLHD